MRDCTLLEATAARHQHPRMDGWTSTGRHCLGPIQRTIPLSLIIELVIEFVIYLFGWWGQGPRVNQALKGGAVTACRTQRSSQLHLQLVVFVVWRDNG